MCTLWEALLQPGRTWGLGGISGGLNTLHSGEDVGFPSDKTKTEGTQQAVERIQDRIGTHA